MTTRTYGGRTLDELKALIPNPHRPPMLSSERGRIAIVLRGAGERILANEVAHKLDDLWRLYEALPEAFAHMAQKDEALRQAATRFREYEAHHAAKPDPEKAARNREMAEACERAVEGS